MFWSAQRTKCCWSSRCGGNESLCLQRRHVCQMIQVRPMSCWTVLNSRRSDAWGVQVAFRYQKRAPLLVLASLAALPNQLVSYCMSWEHIMILSHWAESFSNSEHVWGWQIAKLGWSVPDVRSLSLWSLMFCRTWRLGGHVGDFLLHPQCKTSSASS